jgi:ribonuclease J
MAALSRIASGDHKDVKIIPGDTVLFSSSAIPGNGVSIDNVVNQLAKCGADVITNAVLGDVHSSGHPSKQELRLMLKLVHPKYFMPAHGEYRMLTLHGAIAESMGIPKDNIFILENGDSLTLLKHKITRGYQVQWGVTFIDGYDINGLPKAVIDDRKILTDDGMVSISIGIDVAKGELIVPAEIKTKGVVYEKHQGLMTGIKNEINEMVKRKLLSKPTYNEIKQEMKNIAIKRIVSRTNREPMIVPLIMTKY